MASVEQPPLREVSNSTTWLDLNLDRKKSRLDVELGSSIGSPYSLASPVHSEFIFDAECVSESDVSKRLRVLGRSLEATVQNDGSKHDLGTSSDRERPSMSWRRQRLSAQHETWCEARVGHNERTAGVMVQQNWGVGGHSSGCLSVAQPKEHEPEQGLGLRSLSVNDLDCRPGTTSARQYRSGGPSPSSEDALERAARGPCFPLQPTRAPPERCATPHGLPSFGTQEAQQLRITPRSRIDGLLTDLKDWLRKRRNADGSRDDSGGPSMLHNSNMLHTAHSTTPSDMLRRMLGSSQPIPRATRSVTKQRVALPRGIRVSTEPGALARADDGTIVRGRFGVRASAHGVGQGPLSDHVLVRLEGQAEIDEAVAAIEKACQDVGASDHGHARTVVRNGEGISHNGEAPTTTNGIQADFNSQEAFSSQQEEIRRLREALRELQQPINATATRASQQTPPSTG